MRSLLSFRGLGKFCYWPGRFLLISSIFFFTASRLKDAGSCIGG
jgi:hypothetical protein